MAWRLWWSYLQQDRAVLVHMELLREQQRTSKHSTGGLMYSIEGMASALNRSPFAVAASLQRLEKLGKAWKVSDGYWRPGRPPVETFPR
jgi:hypothetical protein